MDSIKYSINNTEYGYFIVNNETNSLVNIDDKNSESYLEYNLWTLEGNTPGIWGVEN